MKTNIFNQSYGYYPRFRYIPYLPNNGICSHVILSERAKAGIMSEVMLNNEVETGGVLLGYIKNSIWYVVECIDPGIRTNNTIDRFSWDQNYVNHLFERVRNLYEVPLSILGFWHRHPGSMDVFSGDDMATIANHLVAMSKTGLLTMLVNIDPDFRMTFYHAYNDGLMKVGYDIGDEYFPEAALQWLSEENLTEEISNNGRIKPKFAYNRIVHLSCCDVEIENKDFEKKNHLFITKRKNYFQKSESCSESKEYSKQIDELLCEQNMMIESMNMIRLSCQNYEQNICALRKCIEDIGESLSSLVEKTQALNK